MMRIATILLAAGLVLSTGYAIAQSVVTLPPELKVVPLKLSVACLPTAALEQSAKSEGFTQIASGKLNTIERPSAVIDNEDAKLRVYYSTDSRALVNVVVYDKLGYACAIGGADDVNVFEHKRG